MKSRFLFSHKLRPVGDSIGFGIDIRLFQLINDFDMPDLETNVYDFFNGDGSFIASSRTEGSKWIRNNVSDEITSVLLIIGGLLVSLSRTKNEDEYISKIRMESLVWAVYVNYGILLLAVLFVFGTHFLNIMIYNMFTILLFFTFRFHYVLYKSKRAIIYEE